MDLTGLTGTIPQNGMLQCNQHANTANSKPSRTARMSKKRDTFKYVFIYMYIWRFPKMEVPPKSPIYKSNIHFPL